MDLFDIVENTAKIKASSVARTRQSALVTVTVTPQRITNNFNGQALKEAGITTNDLVDITYTKDGKYLLLEVMEGGLKLLTQAKNTDKTPNASVRLTNKEDLYPNFLDGNPDGKVVLKNAKINYDKENRRLVCELKKSD